MVHPGGAALDALIEALAPRSVAVVAPEHVGAGVAARVGIATPEHVADLRAALPRAAPVLALAEGGADPDPMLEAGAEDVLVWPGSTRLLLRRLEPYLSGDLGRGRLVLDPSRTTSLVHAVRNPLNVITLYAELLKMEALGEDARGSVERLVRAAKRVDALVGELESLLYLQIGQAPLRPQPVELGELARAVVAEHALDLEDKELRVQVETAERDTLAQADPDLARRALHAVFGRVVKLCLGGFEVRVDTLGPPPTVRITAPIPPVPAERQDAFHSPGSELDARESLGGVGVGLSFAHGVLRACGGTLRHDLDAQGRAVVSLVFAPQR